VRFEVPKAAGILAVLAVLAIAQTPTAAVPTEVALIQIALIQPVRNEVPAASLAVGVWTLKRAPMFGAACYRNGVRQAPGSDYTIAGSIITSAFWQAGDTLLCDY
jgi:hypothetical protein